LRAINLDVHSGLAEMVNQKVAPRIERVLQAFAGGSERDRTPYGVSRNRPLIDRLRGLQGYEELAELLADELSRRVLDRALELVMERTPDPSVTPSNPDILRGLM